MANETYIEGEKEMRKSPWRFKDTPRKNQFPRDSIMGQYQGKQLAHDIECAVPKAFKSVFEEANSIKAK